LLFPALFFTDAAISTGVKSSSQITGRVIRFSEVYPPGGDGAIGAGSGSGIGAGAGTAVGFFFRGATFFAAFFFGAAFFAAFFFGAASHSGVLRVSSAFSSSLIATPPQV
jgi:hypothetical protein